MRFVSIASGSSGNCIYAGTESTHILVDAGISAKRIEQGLFEVGLKAGEVNAICITHEHTDHVRGLGVLARKYAIPIYGTKGTLQEIQKIKGLGEYPEELLHPVLPDVKFTVGDMDVLPFHIDHDAADPVAYRIQSGNKSIAVATDLGHYNQYTIDHLLDLDAVLLESNHDLRNAGDRSLSVLSETADHGRFRPPFQRKCRAAVKLHLKREDEAHPSWPFEPGK